MTAVYSTCYDDAVSGERWAAEKRCEAVKAALAAAGIAAAVEDDPPWMDAGNLSGYFQDCSGGRMFVMVSESDRERAKAVAAAPG